MNSSTIIGLIITFCFVILGLIFPKSKKIFYIEIIWTWILLALNYAGVDYKVHTNIYESASLSGLSITNSWLYILICYLAKTLNITFYFLNMLINTVGLFLINRVIDKSTEKKAYAGAFLLIYPLVESIIQKRFFIASCFAVYGLFFMLKKENKYKIKSLICLLIAGSLHQAAFAYLIFWLLLQIDYKKMRKIIYIFLIGAFCSIPIIPKIAGYIFPSGKVQLYFYDLKVSIDNAGCWMILHFMFFILISLFVKKVKNNNEKDNSYEIEIYKLNMISLLLIPLYYYEPTFIRIYRGLLVFNYILIANKESKLTKNRFYFTALWLLYLIIVYLLIYVITGSGFDSVVEPEFANNYFIKFLAGLLGV